MKILFGAFLMSITTGGAVVAAGFFYLVPAIRQAVADEVAAQLHAQETQVVPVSRAKEPHPFTAMRRSIETETRRVAAARAMRQQASPELPPVQIAGARIDQERASGQPFKLEHLRTRDGGACIVVRQAGDADGEIVSMTPPGCAKEVN